MFLTIAYRGGWIHFSNTPQHPFIRYENPPYRAQYIDANGNYVYHNCKSEHAAKCFLTRKMKELS